MAINVFRYTNDFAVGLKSSSTYFTGLERFRSDLGMSDFSYWCYACFKPNPMRDSNTSFVANEAGIEGQAVISIDVLAKMSHVELLENIFYCPAGEYGYIEKKARTINRHIYACRCVHLQAKASSHVRLSLPFDRIEYSVQYLHGRCKLVHYLNIFSS